MITDDLTGRRNQCTIRIPAQIIIDPGDVLRTGNAAMEAPSFSLADRITGIDPNTEKYVHHFTNNATEPSTQENTNEKWNTVISHRSIILNVKYRF